jgi:hypothetical protein
MRRITGHLASRRFHFSCSVFTRHVGDSSDGERYIHLFRRHTRSERNPSAPARVLNLPLNVPLLEFQKYR